MFDRLLPTLSDTVLRDHFSLYTILVFIVALGLAYFASMIVGWIAKRISAYLTRLGDTAPSYERTLQLRRLETYLSIALALARTSLFLIAVITAWQLTHPRTASAALIGASTIIALLAGATVVPVVRDLTTGSIMIAERWYNVGDYISILPFGEVSGIVERMNLRSTKLRSITGEAIWVHNQNIQGIRVTSNGVRTLAMDFFVNSLASGKELLEHLASTLPVSPTMLTEPLEIVRAQKLNTRLWHVTAIGQTAPGREWLLEDFASKAAKEYDQKHDRAIVHGPIVHYADAAAERRFKRAVRLKAPRAAAAKAPTTRVPAAKKKTAGAIKKKPRLVR